jgi:deoxyribonuclease (pyrimidine dimer)
LASISRSPPAQPLGLGVELMTRINVVRPSHLHDKHLLAEYRELPRVFSLVRAAQLKGKGPADLGLPTAYCLGQGHVKFFYDKLAYLLCRQKMLISELEFRGFSPNFTQPEALALGLRRHWMNDWAPSADDQLINCMRIVERMPAGPSGITQREIPVPKAELSFDVCDSVSAVRITL